MIGEPLDLSCAYVALESHRETFEVFGRLLVEQNRTLNLTRIDSPEAIVTRHFLDSLAALGPLDALAGAGRTEPFCVIDVGSGAGFPSLALAVARPDWSFVSVEATAKKVHFQRCVCEALGLGNVDVRVGRAEMLAHDVSLRERFDAATARAVARLDILAELTLGFVRPGGAGLYWKGPQGPDECQVAAGAFAAMGAASRMLAYSLSQTEATTFYLVMAEKQRPAPSDYPRSNFGAIKKRPLS